MNEIDPFDDFQDKESTPVQVDLYGIKLRLTPSAETSDQSRITWRALRDDISQSLLRICRDSIGFVADVFTGARSFIRGIAALPRAVASRIGRAHQSANRLEMEAQERLGDLIVTPETKAQSVEQLEELFDELRAQGIPVHLEQLPSGQNIITIVRPGHVDTALDCAADVMANYLEDLSSNAIEPIAGSPLQEMSKPTSEQYILDRPISDLQLTIRVRKAMVRLGLSTIGELVQRSPDELLRAKSFGLTSLEEVRTKLAARGLKLRDDDLF